ncbi:MAG TPA: hypothetical protein VFH29_09055 [Anaerolineales bacterium]|nr:hypothetical protein [Anaerolineales bacterium]
MNSHAHASGRALGFWRRIDPTDRARALLAAVIFLVGAAVRLRMYLSGRSLWNDEAALAVNIVHRGLFGLFPPLEFRQVTPVGFLMLVKILESLLGNTEFVLRLIPLLAGLCVMPVAFVLARRWSSGTTPWLSLALVAVAPALLYYSSEFKQYSTDALAALILLLAGAACVHESAKSASLIRLGVASLVLSWISFPAIFVLGAVFGTLGLSYAIHRDWPRLRLSLGIALLLGLNFGLLYFSSMRDAVAGTSHTEFWAAAFPPPLSGGGLPWYQAAFVALTNPLGAPIWVIASAFFVLGFISLSVRRWEWASMFAVSILLTFAAAALRLYPFADRLLLFTIPPVLILTAEGVERVRHLLSRRSPILAHLILAACAVLLLFWPLREAFQAVQAPPMRDHIKPALAHIRERRLDSDWVYLYYFAIPQFDYYASLYGLDHLARVDGVESRGAEVAYRDQLESLAGTPRIWFIFVHNYREGRIDEQQYFLRQLDRLGTRLDEFYSSGTTIFLYDLTKPPT